jgi:ankyrin repeat protein
LGSASSVAILIAYGADLKTSLGSSNSFNVGVAALICSAHRDDEEATPIIQLLLEKGVKLNKRGAYGCDTTRPKDSKVEGDTALLAAARSGTAGTIRLLLEGGAKVNVRFSDPSVATGSDQSKGVSGRSNFAYDIIEDGVYETGSTPLIFAAGRIDPDSHMIVKMLIGSGASVKGRDGAKALISAGAAGNIQTVQQLLRAGAIIDAQDEFGTTALMSAAEYGEADVVGFLVNHGADRHLENRAQQTALQVAIQYGYADIQALLVGENSPGKLR